MKPGDLVKLCYGWEPLTSQPHSIDPVDYIHESELSTVLNVDVSRVKILSPRGKSGWVRTHTMDVIQ